MDETPQEPPTFQGHVSMSGVIYEDTPDGPITVEPSAYPEHAIVPLVVYVDDKRYVIGEAVIDGETVKSRIGLGVGNDVLDELFGKPEHMQFSLGSDEVVAMGPEKPKCTCVWNKNYTLKARGHHLRCPTLMRKHRPNDGCGFLGHKDEELPDDSP